MNARNEQAADVVQELRISSLLRERNEAREVVKQLRTHSLCGWVGAAALALQNFLFSAWVASPWWSAAFAFLTIGAIYHSTKAWWGWR